MYKDNFRSKDFYAQKLDLAIEQMAECLERGYSIEIAPSRSGIKMQSVGRKHIVIVGMREQQRTGGVHSGS